MPLKKIKRIRLSKITAVKNQKETGQQNKVNIKRGLLHEKVIGPVVWIIGHRQSIVLCGGSILFAPGVSGV
jgi:hypothetical protein